MINELLWTEKYRPKVMDTLALSVDNRRLLTEYLSMGEIPHLLFLGPPGTGKTTAAEIIIDNLDCQVMRLNASNERGIDIVRGKIGTFVRANFNKRWNIVFLDEVDHMTNDAQAALRNMMETYAEISRFIMTGNFAHKIIEAIQSRCQPMELQELEVKDRFKVLVSILDAERVRYDPQAALSYAARYQDLRSMIQMAQKVALSNDRHLLSISDFLVEGSTVWQLLTKDDWKGLVKVSRDVRTDHQQALIDLFWAVPKNHPKRAEVRGEIAKSVHESGYTPDKVVHFLGTCANLINVGV